MNITDPTSFKARQARIERLQRREIAWRHKRYDYRPPAQKRAAKRSEVKQQRQVIIDGLWFIGLGLLCGAILALGL